MQTPLGTEGTADGHSISADLAHNITDIKDLVYSKEEFSVSELALFEITLVPKFTPPQEDYSPAEALVPLAGYECTIRMQ
ncbi:hypothetical protein BC628DRAFT_1418815 [Trametes gibbosa]|nr:hypothetical protein BC628DRAFT_1418815 [Trametes gibbosa]